MPYCRSFLFLTTRCVLIRFACAEVEHISSFMQLYLHMTKQFCSYAHSVYKSFFVLCIHVTQRYVTSTFCHRVELYGTILVLSGLSPAACNCMVQRRACRWPRWAMKTSGLTFLSSWKAIYWNACDVTSPDRCISCKQLVCNMGMCENSGLPALPNQS